MVNVIHCYIYSVRQNEKTNFSSLHEHHLNKPIEISEKANLYRQFHVRLAFTKSDLKLIHFQ